MTLGRLLIGALALAAVTAAAWYLYDPPWIANVTAGLRDIEQDADGTRFRWTAGSASFFVPSNASEIRLPMRAGFSGAGGQPVVVQISVDGRWMAAVTMNNASEWLYTVAPLPRQPTRRRYRRVDLRVSRVVGFNLGVQLGEPTFR
jgi:hypothetical protein